MARSTELAHKRCHDFEVFDEITFKVVPRFKTSEMSGDEWRTSVAIQFRYKGELIAEHGARDMGTAFILANHQRINDSSPIPDGWLKIEAERCDQPGCNLAHNSKRYVLKRETARDGSFLDDADRYYHMFRRFCDRHSQRGDASREDSDSNYEVRDVD